MDKRIALVTGASRGIGRAIAIQLASDGFFVIINYYQNNTAAKEVIKFIKNRGYDGLVQKFDASVKEEVEEVIKKLNKDLGPIDVLINNAGINRDYPLIRMKHKDWDDVLATNLCSIFHCTQAILKTWTGKKKGHRIINITSVIGEMGFAYSTNYSASKAGVIGFTKALAREIAPKNVTVNAISPGFIETDMTSSLPLDQYVTQVPLGRIGQPEDVAHLVSFLVSDKASYITGQVIRVNGGLYM